MSRTMKKYYAVQQQGSEADIYIYGDITSWPGMDSDVSAYRLGMVLDGLEADAINVYINSYGGEVAEGMAIYNALRRHKAKVKTYCDGFACSAASVIFMAGEERIMSDVSMLMIHHASQGTYGNAQQLHKAADDLEAISEAAANAYRAAVNIDDGKLRELLDNETWITPEDAVSMGFATAIEASVPEDKPTQSVRGIVMEALRGKATSSGMAACVTLDAAQLAGELIAQMEEKLAAPSGGAENTPLKLMRAICNLP